MDLKRTTILLSMVYCLIVYVGSSNTGKIPDEPQFAEKTMNSRKLIEQFGYPCEHHEVLTDDGYYLTLFRIKHGRTKKVPRKRTPVLLVHGLLDSSDTWVINYPHQSLAFILADQGYDVWLGNNRGNQYSLKHEIFPINSTDFWEFSFANLGMLDVPAMIDYITKHTKRPKLHYIGHSEGNMIGFIKFSEDHATAKKVDQFIALAPVTNLEYVDGALKYLRLANISIRDGMQMEGNKRFLPKNNASGSLTEKMCKFSKHPILCSNFLFLVGGFYFQSLNRTRIPVYFSHTPTATSTKNILHYDQIAKSGKFQQYDYGLKQNLYYYNQSTPPEYEISKMTTKTSLFYSKNDWLSTAKDVNLYLKPKLSNMVYEKVIPGYNHFDFIWGTDAWKKLYPHVLHVLKHSH